MKIPIDKLRFAAAIMLTILIFLMALMFTGCKVFNEKETFHTQSYKETFRDSLIYLKGDGVRSNLDSAQIARIENYLKTHKNDTVRIYNHSGNLSLKYYHDQFGQLQVECEKKDETINRLIKTIEKSDSINKSQVKTIVKIEREMTWWGWMALGIMAVVTLYFIIRRIFF